MQFFPWNPLPHSEPCSQGQPAGGSTNLGSPEELLLPTSLSSYHPPKQAGGFNPFEPFQKISQIQSNHLSNDSGTNQQIVETTKAIERKNNTFFLQRTSSCLVDKQKQLSASLVYQGTVYLSISDCIPTENGRKQSITEPLTCRIIPLKS